MNMIKHIRDTYKQLTELIYEDDIEDKGTISEWLNKSMLHISGIKYFDFGLLNNVDSIIKEWDNSFNAYVEIVSNLHKKLKNMSLDDLIKWDDECEDENIILDVWQSIYEFKVILMSIQVCILKHPTSERIALVQKCSKKINNLIYFLTADTLLWNPETAQWVLQEMICVKRIPMFLIGLLHKGAKDGFYDEVQMYLYMYVRKKILKKKVDLSY